GLENYWVPSSPESAVFGTRMTDEFFPVHTGGDAAFIAAVIKVLIQRGLVDQEFVTRHTSGYDALRRSVEGTPLATLAKWAGSSVADVERFAQMYGRSKSPGLRWVLVKRAAHLRI